MADLDCCAPCEPLRPYLFPAGCSAACRGHATSEYDCGHGHVDGSAPGLVRGVALPYARLLLILGLVAAAAARANTSEAQAHTRWPIAVAVMASAAAALVALLLGRTLLVVGSAHRAPAEPVHTAEDTEALARCLAHKHDYAARLGAAIRCRTVSHDASDLQAMGHAAASATLAARDAELRKLQALIQLSFPRVHAALERVVIGQWSLVYIWRAGGEQASSSGELPYMVYAHLDVVPAPDEERWSVDPWAGEVRDGYVWGRGAIDDKHAALGHLEAIEDLLQGAVWP